MSFLKALAYADGHAGYSDPLDEQHYLVDTINAIERSRYWRSTAIMLTYDDSDGWYDHAMPPIVNPSADPATDALNGTGICGHGTPLAGHQDRCGLGPRLPFLLISPYARRDYVDGTLTDQTSVLRFIEDNWLGAQRIGYGSFDAGGLAERDVQLAQAAPRPAHPEPAYRRAPGVTRPWAPVSGGPVRR